MISPIGSFLTRFDTAILGAMNVGITGLVGYLTIPVTTSLAIYYVIQGVRIANGDGAPVQHFVTQLLRNIMILWFCSHADVYDRWVRDFFYTALPSALNKAVLANATAGLANVANGVTGTAAAFDQVWALMDVMTDRVMVEAPLFDVSSRVAAMVAGLAGGTALVVIAMVYLMSRFILAIVIELGVIAVACLIFDATKSIFERWLGKIISLVFLQVAAIVVLQLVITIEQDFMKQILANHSSLPSDVQALTAMVTMFFMGAFAIYSLPAIAYSIGTGVSVSALPAMYLAAKALQGVAGALGNLNLAVPEMAAAEGGLSLGMAQAELSGPAMSAIRAPEMAALPPPLPGF